jgi:hypothetical protein
MTVEELLTELGFLNAGESRDHDNCIGMYDRANLDAHLRYNLGCAGLDQDAGELVADLARDLEPDPGSHEDPGSKWEVEAAMLEDLEGKDRV